MVSARRADDRVVRQAPSQVDDAPDVQVPARVLPRQAGDRASSAATANDEFTLDARAGRPGRRDVPAHVRRRRRHAGRLAGDAVRPGRRSPRRSRKTRSSWTSAGCTSCCSDLRKSRRVQEQVQKIIRAARRRSTSTTCRGDCASRTAAFRFDAGSEQYDLDLARSGRAARMRGGRLHRRAGASSMQTRDGKSRLHLGRRRGRARRRARRRRRA